jgi:ribonuclease HI
MHDFSSIAIASDSLSILMNVMNPDTGNYLARKIAFLIHEQQKITLVWIPGHSGIPGNDKADLETKQATTQECGNES